MQVQGIGVLEHLRLPGGKSVEQAIADLKSNPQIAFAEPNYIYRPTVVSNDPEYTSGRLWGIYSADAPSAAGPAGTTNAFGSAAERAWADNVTGSRNIAVGILDTGILTTHSDLVSNIWVNPDEIAGDGLDNDQNGYVDDIHGWDFVNNDATVFDLNEHPHGTHVAGTIGAQGGNSTGVAGVNWAVSMICAKMIDTNTSATMAGTVSSAIQALDYLTNLKVSQGINVVASNNSWGGVAYSQALHEAIIRGANADILFVAAAGNSANNNDVSAFFPASINTTVGTATVSPASYDAVISVAAINDTGGMSWFSSYGATTVDLGAPGSSIVSTVQGGYYGFSGTSMATPHVTGAAALYASTQTSPIAASAIRSAILNGATPTASLAGHTVTGGRLNVHETIRRSSFIDIEYSTYQPTHSAWITVASSASNLDINTIESLTVYVRSTTEITPLSITLTETRISSGVFKGQIQLASGPAQPGNPLQVTHNDIITAMWPGLNISDTAVVYSVAPSMSEISVNPGPTLAVLSFTTSAPTRAVVRYGNSPTTLSQTVTVPASLTSHTVTLAGLTPGSVLYYSVTVTDAVQNTRSSSVRSFATTLPRPILLVDDDLGAPHEQAFIAALNASAFTFDVWNVAAAGGTTPPASSLAVYQAVIWSTGDGYNSHVTAGAGLSPREQSAIMRYLDGGGRIFISGKDVLFYGVSGTFEQDYLRIASITRGISSTPHTETGLFGHPITDGMNLSVVVPPGFASLNVDAVEPMPGASGLLLHGVTNPMFGPIPAFSGVSYRGNYAAGGFGVVFTTLPFESISSTAADPDNQAAFMKLTIWFLLNPSPPPTKFYTVDDSWPDSTFEYASDGTLVESYRINSGNTAPRGIATVTAGDRLWVVDGSRTVFVYKNTGALLGSWGAGLLPATARLEGIATDGTHIWLIDAASRRVYYYANAAAVLSGSKNATRSSSLHSLNVSPKDLVFGTQGGSRFLWIVDDSADRVFQYTLAANGSIASRASWPLDSANAQPTGITLDPSNADMSIWVSDIQTDRIYRYANGRTGSAPTLTSSFALLSANGNVQRIADPPPAVIESTLVGYQPAIGAAVAEVTGGPATSRQVSLISNRTEPSSTGSTLISQETSKTSSGRQNSIRRRAPASVLTPPADSLQKTRLPAESSRAVDVMPDADTLDDLFSDPDEFSRHWLG
jgi:subtilisin family serine protease